MHIHWLQHVSFEGPGSVADWARLRGHTLSSTRLWANEPLPSQATADWIVVLGGPMNIYEHDRHPWLETEKRWLREAIDAGQTVLGICLGAQLIADVLGGRVTRNAEREIGWFPVRRIPHGAPPSLLEGLPPEFEALHWHGDTFALPPGAVPIARSEACEQQGFVWRERVVGLQFHLETTPESAAALVEHCRTDLTPGRFVQSETEIRSPADRFRRLNALMARLLDNLGQLPRLRRNEKGDRLGHP